jgi:biotin synthase-related radical SAM superfamily protein
VPVALRIRDGGKALSILLSGGQFEALAKRNKPMPFIPSPQDMAEVVRYAIENDGVDSVQITGGSTFKAEDEQRHIMAYMSALNKQVGRKNIKGEILLYITAPEETDVIDRYFELGADRIACSLEIWDDARAKEVMPGKREFTTKKRYLDALEYMAEKYGPGKAFSNFIVGLEPLETLSEGATYLAQRGIIPSASVWMPFGKPVMGSMKPPELDYYRRVKEMQAELYVKYDLKPAGGCGLNVCVERDIRNWAVGDPVIEP